MKDFVIPAIIFTIGVFMLLVLLAMSVWVWTQLDQDAAAKAIEIEGGTLTEEYIRCLWVRQQINLNDKTVIYIPTEAGLSVLEAGKREISQ